jgi:hypothetical protein
MDMDGNKVQILKRCYDLLRTDPNVVNNALRKINPTANIKGSNTAMAMTYLQKYLSTVDAETLKKFQNLLT